VIGLELALMRELSIRFWQHCACMIISTALLGFGASGVAIMLVRERIRRAPQAWLAALAQLLACAVPASLWAGRLVPLNPYFLAWRPGRELLHVLALELIMFVPFFLGGCLVGIALAERPERIRGHYAASLFGSGAGAAGTVLLMHCVGASWLFVAMAAVAWAASLPLLRWQTLRRAARGLAVLPALLACLWLMPKAPAFSEYKMMSHLRLTAGAEVIRSVEGPLGRIDVVAGPHVHYAPGLSLNYFDPVPPHVLLLADGEQLGAVYDCRSLDDWRFMDYTTAALPYHLRAAPKVVIVGGGGGADIGLGLHHGSRSVTVLEMNAQLICLMREELFDRGGAIYGAEGVQVVNREARGFLAGTRERFDVAQLPSVDAFGASGAGLYASQESYLYTVEAFSEMLNCLADDGLLCVTRWARTPPRDGLRVFDMAAEALRRQGLAPAPHLAMVRSWVTTTVLISKRPFTAAETAAIRAFCADRSFDLCWLPGLAASEVNRCHVLERPIYYETALALLGDGREGALGAYLFDIEAATDDKPYFSHFFRWRALGVLRKQPGRQGAAYVELGALMLGAALLQAICLSVALLLVPLLVLRPGRRGRAAEARSPPVGGSRSEADGGEVAPRAGETWGAAAVLTYFSLIGAGFMLLEMGFLQKLILYLAHPTYAAAAAIASFLVFAGVGSELSGVWRAGEGRIMAAAGSGVVVLAGLYALGLDAWLGLTQAQPLPLRFGIAVLTAAPLAAAMGHMFPAALRRVAAADPALTPFAWAVNGCASVTATVATPLLAMSVGFSRVMLLAALCYAGAVATVARAASQDAMPLK